MADSSKPAPGVIKKLDEVVVNRIAAGEVIQRPANALKEMLENSLDAKSSQITVTVKGGGLKLLQICDNGTGIRREDMEIVAERFTTSKLRDFKDLTSISTYGFRGEALASISHVAQLTILTKTRDSPCGYKAEYVDGKLKGAPKPCAGNQGTTITVENLFYNVSNRLGALRSPSEEFNKIAEVMTRYAIHNSGVGFTLKKAGENSVDVKTQPSNSVIDNIRLLYGPSVAKELIEFKMEDERYQFKASGYLTNVNYSVKKFVFLLFINHRLVESTALKKSLEHVYSSYLPKGGYPFAYLSLEIAPHNVDVNVHPTKHEVFFLHQDIIVEKIQIALEEKLLKSNASRTFYTQKLLPGATPTIEIFDGSKEGKKGEKQIAPKDFIRTDSAAQKLDKFLVKSGGKSMDKSSNESSENVKDKSRNSDEIQYRECKLSSVQEMKKKIQDASSQGCRDMFANHTFVGCVNRKFALFQHTTKLYLANTIKFSEMLFRQLLVKDFGNFGVIKLNPPPTLKDLGLIALDLPEAGWSEEDGDKEELANNLAGILFSNREMLDDYFSLQLDIVDGQECLVGLPLLLESYCPWLGGLPLYMLRLSTEVDWNEEAKCFEDFISETVSFYRIQDVPEAVYTMNQHQLNETVDDVSDDDHSWKFTVEHTLFPAMKKHLHPPRSSLSDKSLLQIANLPDLYKVFERC